ncbi:FmdE family protein [Desulfovibrionales bacterium]
MSCQIPKERIDAVIAFHGHSCPGLAIGIRAAELALSRLNNPTNTQIVAVVETDMCGVDAIQFLTGATLGKGNLIHRDYGKMAFSFFHRDTGAGFRAVLDPEARGGMDVEMAELMKKNSAGTATQADTARIAELRSVLLARFMDLPLEKMFQITELEQGMPRSPQILQSLTCACCGEKTMESRTRRFAGATLCIPCFAQVEQKV